MRHQLQRSLVRSHAAGSGPEVEREVVRALMLLRLSTLATGHTGIRRETAELMAALLTHDITPVVREYGSLGCSGDLAPLSHCALVLMGEGEVRDASGELVAAADALAEAGLTPDELEAKEGLALINGTDGMLGMLVLALHDLRTLLATADISAAMSVEGQLGTDRVFGNFHGAPLAHALDFLAIVAADVAELKRLAAPASVDSIPSSAMQEDHVSMGWNAARKLRRSVDGLGRVLAVEVLTAARALDLRAPLTPAPATAAVVALLREAGVEGPGPDRYLSPEIEAAVSLVQSGAVLAAAEGVVGELR